MFTKEKPPYKKISQAKKRKLWNSEECTQCHNDKENLIHAYKIRGLELIGEDEKICTDCLKSRREALKELLTAGEE